MITRRNIEQANGVYTFTDRFNNIQLLRTELINPGFTITLRCEQNEVHQATCQRNRQFRPALPVHCHNPRNVPDVSPLPHTNNACPTLMFLVGHTFNNHTLELYRTCYNPQTVRAYFSDVTLYPKTILPTRPNVQFSTDQLITPAQAASYLTRNIFRTFRRIYGQNQQYIRNNRHVVINRGHLTASSDFLFGDQAAGTFKYLNVVPQFQSINDGNWKLIEEWIHTQIPNTSILNVRTGALGVLSLADSSPRRTLKQAYLAGRNQNPVPTWMYKIVRDANNLALHAFITYNNVFVGASPPAPANCRNPIPCPLNLTSTAAMGYTYCCDPATFTI
ncbi:uncharacterized protein LOC116805396 [Drosophila grimshawi]|uniref:GH23404 n=1 Tax=Drosophila grimshawi TaxID=7222 RepID=B4K1L6_DROGR|nr:uncharacterized protein LOC116805396 [Drosophila grimshawi]EDW04952.1 GH23404 [Drosophila grimshawi]